MRPISKTARRWMLGAALFMAASFVWWTYMAAPLQDRLEELDGDLEQTSIKRDRMTRTFQKLSDAIEKHKTLPHDQTALGRSVVEGENLEEVNAITQLWVQEFFQKNGITLQSYQVLPPSKWRDYLVGLTRNQLECSTQGLSDLLENLEVVKKAIRIDKLTIRHRKTRDNDLQVILEIGTLLVKGSEDAAGNVAPVRPERAGVRKP